MEAVGGRRHTHTRRVLTAGPTSLTCMCKGTERADQGQHQQQLNVHRGEKSSSPPTQTTARDSLGGGKERDTGALARARHAPTGLSGGEGAGQQN